MKKYKRYVRLTGEHYNTLMEFNKAHEVEKAALLFAKKDGKDVVVYSVLLDEKFIKESTDESVIFDVKAVEAEMAAASSRDGADALVISHTHPHDNYAQLSMLDKFAYRAWVLDEKKYKMEIFMAVIIPPYITFWDCEGLRIDQMGLMVDGQHIESPKPQNAVQRMASVFTEGWVRLPTTAVALYKKEAKDMKGEHIIIPAGYTHIYESAFEGRNDIVTVTIPDGVIRICSWAFAQCKNLKTVMIPVGVTVIDKYTFFLSKSLETLRLPDGLTTISEKSFHNCENLVSMFIPGSVINIHETAFKGCKNLTVTCPKGSYAHQYCLLNKINVNIF